MLLRKHLSLNDADLKLDGDTGAFNSALKSGMPMMYLEHAAFTGAIGAAGLPIGKWTKAREDDRGLYVEGELTPGMSLSADVRAAMRHGTLSGLSVGGFVKKGDYDDTETGRVIRRWSKLVEVSVVARPADSAARVDLSTVKGADILDAIAEIESIRDLESLLRDAAGLSKSAAAALVGRAKLILSPQGGPAGDAEQRAMKAIADRLAGLAG